MAGSFSSNQVSVFEDKRIDLTQNWLNHYELEVYLLMKLIKMVKMVIKLKRYRAPRFIRQSVWGKQKCDRFYR